MTRLFIGLFLCLMTLSTMGGDAGAVASNTHEILDNIIAIIMTILYVAAMGVFMSALMKYRIHRQNPQQIPLSTPLTELILAIVLAAIPTISKITNGELFSNKPSTPPPVAPIILRAPVVVPAQPQYVPPQ